MKSEYSNKEKAFLKQIGKQIKKLRKEQGLSQEAFSFKCNLDRTYIGSVERGERNISIINVSKIADALHVSISELLRIEKNE